MPDFLTLTCPTCGAKLKVTDQINMLVCASCGNEHMVHRDGGAIYLAPMAQDVKQIRVGVDKTAAELAIARLTKELNDLEIQLSATQNRSEADWLGNPDGVKVLVLFSFLSFLIGVIAYNTHEIAPGIVLLGIGVILCVLAFSVASNRKAKSTQLRKSEITRLSRERSVRYEQLRKNRQIAES